MGEIMSRGKIERNIAMELVIVKQKREETW
jgi:hypothetical protein